MESINDILTKSPVVIDNVLNLCKKNKSKIYKIRDQDK